MTGAGLGGISFLDALRGQVDHILDACTKCGKCVEACPMVEPAGLDPADGVAITDGVLDLLAGGGGTKAAERWAQVCTNSGKCIPACDYGINPRFMVNMARIASKAKLGANEVRRAANEYFNAQHANDRPAPTGARGAGAREPAAAGRRGVHQPP